MPFFRIACQLSSQTVLDGRGREIYALKLDDEYTIILCVYSGNQKSISLGEVNSFSFRQAISLSFREVNSVEIHRKNTAEDILVSGELTFERCYPTVLKKVLRLIKIGSSFTEICSSLSSEHIGLNSSIKGYLHISNANEKQFTVLANEESKHRIKLNSLVELSNNFERLLNPDPSCFADVTLKCGSVSVPAHKIILAARSPVFAAMFAHPMMESLGNEVDVTDIDVLTLQALLWYVYTGKTSDLTTLSAARLLFAADKYQLPDLKAVCSYFLKETVSAENMWNILVLGDMYSEDLKSFAVDYICKKCADFSVLENSEKWKALRKERSNLAMELLESLVKYRDGKPK